MQHNPVIAFIGAGNMASSLIGGLIADGYAPAKIWASDLHAEKLNHLKDTYGINIAQHNHEVIEHAEIVMLAVKPQVLKDVACEIAQQIQQQKALVISIAAGVTEQSLRNWLGEVAIVRCMPNTPALVKSGATGLFANQYVSELQRNFAEAIMRAVGLTVWLHDERDMDAVTALSGSGPAYFFLVMEAMEQAATQLGLDQHTARLLTLQTALGSAKMALESAESTAELRQRVTSPGGTTEQAIKVLEDQKVREIFNQALRAAQQRSMELAKILAK